MLTYSHSLGDENPFVTDETAPRDLPGPQTVLCTTDGCRAAGVEQIQLLLNILAPKYKFAPVAVTGVLGPETAIALAKVGVGQQYNTFSDQAKNALWILGELNQLASPKQIIPDWALYALGAAALIFVGAMFWKGNSDADR